MSIIDSSVEWLVRRTIIPNLMTIDQPGYVFLNTEGKIAAKIRSVVLPEQFYVALENEAKNNLDLQQALYRSGKTFGYRYAALAEFTQREKASKSQFENDVYFTLKLVAGTYCKKLTSELDYEKQRLQLEVEDFVICRKSGLGAILTEGGIAGIWAFGNNNGTIEAVQTECQGRGNATCKITIAPKSQLESEKIQSRTFSEVGLTFQKTSYLEKNKVRPTQNSKNSLKTLLQARKANLENGAIFLQKERYFDAECGLIDILDLELAKIPNGQPLLFESAKTAGKQMVAGNDGTAKYICDIFTPMGFGDVFVSQKNEKMRVQLDNPPWNEYVVSSNQTVLAGLFSGALESVLKRPIKLNKKPISYQMGLNQLILEE